MTGINGKNNKTKKNIVLFDKSISLEEINSIRYNKNLAASGVAILPAHKAVFLSLFLLINLIISETFFVWP